MGPQNAYNFLTQKLGFTSLVGGGVDDSNLGVAIGGVHEGVTVKEMTAAFQIFGNGGQYNEPYTYYYVEEMCIRDSHMCLLCSVRFGSCIFRKRNSGSTNSLCTKGAYLFCANPG